MALCAQCALPVETGTVRVGTAFIFSFAGATAVSLLPKDAVRPLVLVLLIAMLAYTLWKKDFGALHRPQEITAVNW